MNRDCNADRKPAAADRAALPAATIGRPTRMPLTGHAKATKSAAPSKDSDGQQLERGGRVRCHLVGALGAQCLGAYVEHAGDREELLAPAAVPGRVIH